MNKSMLHMLVLTALTVFSFQYLYPPIETPPHFPTLVYNFQNNPPTNAKIQLGRALFYDPILSKDSSISCASCHSPFNAFAHSDHALSHGIGDSIGTRNAPALFNLGWQGQFMWDGAINHLDMQALAPIEHAAEMGESLGTVLKKLNNKPLYKHLFYQVWQDSSISTAKMLKALAAFQLSLVSAQSKYDGVMLQKDTFNRQQENGYQLFQQHCNRCHQEPLFSNFQLANNGLALDSNLMDYGKAGISMLPDDHFLFKTPSLRNLKYSAPYMHDGRFSSLRDVLKHYASPKTKQTNLDSLLQKGIALDDRQMTDILAFLQCLNDQKFVFNPNHRFPRALLLESKK